MYRCGVCGRLFDEPKKVIEHQFGSNLPDRGYNEVYFVCPSCGNSEYREIVECCECGEEYFADCETLFVYFKSNDDYVCNDCLHDYCKENFS